MNITELNFILAPYKIFIECDNCENIASNDAKPSILVNSSLIAKSKARNLMKVYKTRSKGLQIRKNIKKPLQKRRSILKPVGKRCKISLDGYSGHTDEATEHSGSLESSFFIETEESYGSHPHKFLNDYCYYNSNPKDSNFNSRTTTAPHSRYNSPNKDSNLIFSPLEKALYTQVDFDYSSEIEVKKDFYNNEKVSAYDYKTEGFELDFDNLPNCLESFDYNLSVFEGSN